MARRWIVGVALLLAAPVYAQEALPRTALSFQVDVTDPASAHIQVSLEVAHNTQDELRLAIPAWAPGAYRVVKYSRAVRNVRASGKGGAKLDVWPEDDQTWKVKTGGAATVTVQYELSVEASRMDKDHCFIAGPDTYFYLRDRKDTPCAVRFKLPEGWRVGTGLDRDGELYKARDYDTFIDCPTELGTFDLVEFEADQAKYQLVIHARGPVDGQKLSDMCRKIVREQNKIFGAVPFERYVFFYHFNDRPGGRGLEHLNSTDISMTYAAIKAYPLLAASVSSHEYFHLWNVKRIRPFELGPFDYTKAVPTQALWFCEGVTSYVGDRSLARCGIWSEEQYLAHLAGEVETLQNNPDRKVTSVEKASSTVWDRKDYPRVDYYNKGELLGLLIDVKMRTGSDGKKTMDDLFRHLYKVCCQEPAKAGKGWIGVGFAEDGLLRALNEVSGGEWNEFYGKYISGVEELPYTEVLGPAGLLADVQVNRSASFGMDLRGTLVQVLSPGGPAQKAGLERGDRLKAINGVDVARDTIRDEMAKLKVGEEATVKVERNGGTIEVKVQAIERERTSCKIRRAPAPTPAQKRLLDSWLGKHSEF